MKLRNRISVAVTAALLGPVTASGQSAPQDSIRPDQEAVRVRGFVTDIATQRPLQLVEIEVFDFENERRLAWEGVSDSMGAFVGPRLPPSLYQVRAVALGYQTLTHMVALSGYGIAEIQIEMSPEALELEPLVVVTRQRSRLEAAGFYERRQRGFGHSLDRADIEERRPTYVTDLMRMMPGVSVAPGMMGGGGILRMRGGCIPEVIMDGVRMVQPVRLDDVLQVSDLEGLEVYGPGASPLEYSHSNCGTVLAWTRDPGSTDGRPWSWKRAGAAAGFILLGFFLTR
jgi:hypothetical protein